VLTAGLKVRAAVLLAGDSPKTNIATVLKDMLVVCADGAYVWAREQGITPDIFVGDLDSLNAPPQGAGEVILHNADKDATDGELAVDCALSRGAESVAIYGGGGGRDDHYMGNLMLLARAADAGAEAVMHTEYCEIHICKSLFQKYLKPGTTVSVVPFCGDAHILDTEGLKYALKSSTLKAGSTLGISNVVTDSRVRVEVARGMALVYIVRG